MDKKHKFNEQVETHLAQIVIDREYVTGKQNQQRELSDFKSYVDMFDAERTEKEYDWMSNISIPEFSSHMLTQSSIDVSQYFQTRDFVECFINDEGDIAQKAAKSNQELINRTLNRRDLYHYQKFVRSKTINHLGGHVDYQCWWERDGYKESELGEDDYGEPVEYEVDVVTKDKFCYEVLDPRNTFTDSKYCYSMQDREWVIIRSERSLTQLKKEAKQFGYFNLDLLEDDKYSSAHKTETHSETVEDGTGGKSLPENKTGALFDIFKRYGKFWVDNKDGPGIDENGEVKKGSDFSEVAMTFAVKGGTKILIGFHRQPYKDAYGNTYRPLIRGLCYIHPTRDAGVGDGKYAHDPQIAVNDTFNVAQDRTLLGTIPTFKVKKYLAEDTDTLYFKPGHGMECNEKDDIEEFKINDNTEAAMGQLAMLFGKMQQASAIFPTTMGNMPMASSTATAVAGAEQRSNQRTNYKSMTFEYTALTELYWMITQMTYQFATEKTGFQLMGEKVYDFNPTLEYTYKPLSQSIETEYSKNAKVKLWIQILGYVVNVGHPDAVNLLNYILMQIAELMGDEYSKFAKMFLSPGQSLQPQDNQQAMASQGGGPSNQYMIPQSTEETGARAGAGGYV
uniref:Portal protein n=1 Tax=viral metagenome TaxID=1070528 RepID=A0A6M3XN29_9ZZZZ